MEVLRAMSQEDIKRFRRAFKDEALEVARQSIQWKKEGKVGVITLDQLNEKANKLSSPNMLRFYEVLIEIEADKGVEAIVVISKKPSIFIAGADIAEIAKFSEAGEEALDSMLQLQKVFNYLEAMSIPSIAAIHGACMGGGMELALACDYRMCTDGPETKLALPEVMLGLIPGWGGTQRMPRLVGLEKGLDMILTGKSLDGKRAKKMGLVDKVVPKEYLESKALLWAHDLAKTKKKRTYEDKDLKEKLLGTVPGASWLVTDIAKKQVMQKTKGNYPAPLKALEVVRQTYGGSLEKGLEIEAKAFVELVKTPESKSLISLFYLQDRAKKDRGVTAKIVSNKEVRNAAVLGAGVMGGGIAQSLAAKNIRVRMKDMNWDAVAKGYQAAAKVFKKLQEKKRMKPSDVENAMALIEGTTQFNGFKNLDVVIEAVVENLEVKQKVFQELEQKVSENCLLASNTSSLSITDIGKGLKNPKRMLGLHFFNPVDKMPLLEIVRGKETSDEAIAAGFQLAKKLGKTPLLVQDSPGFVVNRVLSPYLIEAVHLIRQGVSPEKIDQIAVDFGMPMGPCELLDEVGLDTVVKICKILYGAYGERMKMPPGFDVFEKEKAFGKKSGKGIYLYPDGRKKGELNTAAINTLQPDHRTTDVTDEEIQKRLFFPMVNEASRILEENLVRSPDDIEVGVIFGIGFPPFRGGVLRYADQVGVEVIVSELELLSRSIGNRFQPSNYLQQLSVAKGKIATSLSAPRNDKGN